MSHLNPAQPLQGDGLEPLADLADLAWEQAPALCRHEHGCMDYHRAWGMVRLLLGQGRLPAGESFFRREIARIASKGRRRVLVSGGADSGLSAMVVQAFRSAGAEPELVFADRCATAGMVNARYAEAVGAKMQVVLADLSELVIDPVDLVVAHSFLPFFEGDRRQAVLQAWYRSLGDGGEVLLSNVLRASEDDWVTQKSPEDLLKNSQALGHAALGAGYSIDTATSMQEVAQRFWALSPGRPPGLTEANLREGLARAGFEDIHFRRSERAMYQGPISLVRKKLDSLVRAEVCAVKRGS